LDTIGTVKTWVGERVETRWRERLPNNERRIESIRIYRLGAKVQKIYRHDVKNGWQRGRRKREKNEKLGFRAVWPKKAAVRKRGGRKS